MCTSTNIYAITSFFWGFNSKLTNMATADQQQFASFMMLCIGHDFSSKLVIKTSSSSSSSSSSYVNLCFGICSGYRQSWWGNTDKLRSKHLWWWKVMTEDFGRWRLKIWMGSCSSKMAGRKLWRTTTFPNSTSSLSVWSVIQPSNFPSIHPTAAPETHLLLPSLVIIIINFFSLAWELRWWYAIGKSNFTGGGDEMSNKTPSFFKALSNTDFTKILVYIYTSHYIDIYTSFNIY